MSELEDEKIAGVDELKAALTGDTNVGAELLPVETAEEIIEYIRCESFARQAFQEIAMDKETLKIPSFTASVTYYGYAKTDVDGVTDTAPATSEVQLDMKTIIANVPIKRRVLSYGIGGILGLIKRDIAEELRYQEENMMVNGDTTSGATNINGTLSSGDVRLEFYGLRYKSLNNNITQVNAAGSGLLLSHIRSMIGNLGKYGKKPSDLVLLVSLRTKTQVMAWDELETLDKYGPKATIYTGEIGKIYGISVIATDLIAENLEADGTYDAAGSQNRTVVLLVNRESPLIGTPTHPERRFAIEIEEEATKDLITLAPREDIAFNLRWDDAIATTRNLDPNAT